MTISYKKYKKALSELEEEYVIQNKHFFNEISCDLSKNLDLNRNVIKWFKNAFKYLKPCEYAKFCQLLNKRFFHDFHYEGDWSKYSPNKNNLVNLKKCLFEKLNYLNSNYGLFSNRKNFIWSIENAESSIIRDAIDKFRKILFQKIKEIKMN
ncbi:hypothetical protein ACW95P_01865 [Candidatus Mycoplasma pogonae]